ncbi:hypothetical protein ACH4F6_21660 [Streptomyces sp. NPDC017936]|uniref:hypothetical protein n=1 Tax=Streptomyces sp. NPDC017936 TaxID=3365016 RepID=UPI00379F1507
MLKARHTKAAVIAATAALALAGCGSGDDGGSGKEDKPSASPSVPADPYQKAPWRLQVVNLLTALRTPEDGTYRSWMRDDPELWTQDFIYTPRDATAPGWSNRGSDGASVVYPGKMDPAEKKAFFNGITLDNTVLPDTLTVVDAGDETVAGDNQFQFTFKVETTQGKWVTGMAIGSPGTEAAKGHITRLSYDPGQ